MAKHRRNGTVLAGIGNRILHRGKEKIDGNPEIDK
jgi:hypothetical protein